MGKWTKGLILIFLAINLAACQPVDKHVVKLGANDWLGYQPFFTAQSLGLFNANDISVVELGSSTEVLRAFYNGALDLAALTLDETLSAIAQGKDLKILMVIDFSYGGDTLIAQPDIESLEQLKGKKVAVEGTALGAVMLDAALTKANLDLADVKIELATYDEHEHALRSGKANAVVTFEPVRSKLLADGFREIFNSREIPGTIIDLLVVNAESLEKYPEKIQSLMAAYFQARQLIMEGDVAAVASIAKRIGLNRDAIQMSYEQIKLPDLEENKRLMSQCAAGFNGTADKLVEITIARDMIDKAVSLNAVCNNNYVNELIL